MHDSKRRIVEDHIRQVVAIHLKKSKSYYNFEKEQKLKKICIHYLSLLIDKITNLLLRIEKNKTN